MTPSHRRSTMAPTRAHSVLIHHTADEDLDPGQLATVTRTHYQPNFSYCAHDHDYFEVFWVEEGNAMHVINDTREELPMGTVVFMRPSDVHAFETMPSKDLTMVNVVLSPQALIQFQAIYGAAITDWPWPDPATTSMPVHRRLDRRALDTVQDWADAISRNPHRLTVDGLLLTLIQWTSAAIPDTADDIPLWLRQAVLAFSTEQHFASGITSFARLAGRGKAHLNRSVRRYYGTTATELVNKLRLEQASRQLGMTDESILGIALACGFDSLSYFYRVFRATYGETPQQWRDRHRTLTRTASGHAP